MDEAVRKRRATYQDVLQAPPNKVAEVIGGELRLSPRPAGPHSSVIQAASAELGPPFGRGRGGPGGWLILIEPELHFGDEILVPDLVGWRRERLSVVPDEPYITVVPDWVCEVLSKSTEKMDRAEKMPLFASLGIGHAWLIHPRRRTLEAYRLVEGRWTLLAVHKDDDRKRIEPFDAIELDLSMLWADLPLPNRAMETASEYEFEFEASYSE